jgi:fucose permease
VVCVALAAWATTIPAPIVETHRQSSATQRNSRVALAVSASFFVLYVGLEVGFSGWIFTYAEEIDFSALAATWLTTVFWMGFTFGRLLSSIFADWFAPKAILRTASGLTIGAALLLLIGDGNVSTVWLATALMGLATAPQFPVMFTFLERRISMTGRATSWFVGGAGLGLLIAPWLIGQWLGRSGVVALPRAMVVLGLLTFGAFTTAGRVLGEPRDSASR